jgi:hypothetical protein
VTTSPSRQKRALPFPELVALRRPVPLSTPYWTEVDSAIAWIGFGNALPVSWWDTELAFGLSLWPWYGPLHVLIELERRKEEPDCEWLLDQERGRSTEHLGNALFQFRGRRRENPWTAEGRPYEGLVSTRASSDASMAELCAEAPRHQASRLSKLRERAEDAAAFVRAVEFAERVAADVNSAVRDEAARCHAAWGIIQEGVVAAFHQASLAADALLAALARGEITAYGVPLAHSGYAGANAAGRVAIPASSFAGPVTLAPDGLYLFLPRERFSVEERRAAFVKIVLPASDVNRLFSREPGEWPDLRAGATPWPTSAGKSGASAVTPDEKPELVAKTGSPGRPSKSKDLYMAEHRRRLASGEACEEVADEAHHLLDVWLPQAWPTAIRPTLSTLQKAITPTHRHHFEQPRLRSGGGRTK